MRPKLARFFALLVTMLMLGLLRKWGLNAPQVVAVWLSFAAVYVLSAIENS